MVINRFQVVKLYDLSVEWEIESLICIVGFTKGSTAQWLFSSKVSAVPHLMSFRVSQDEKPFDSTLKFPAPELQKSFNHNGQGGFHFSMTPYPVQHDVNSVNRPHDVKIFSISNQAISVSVGNP
ncbi:uncharacterized protein LOC110263786 [Arachis ipaensis]|uniref:uncharacterized protein LOC110263786 n=1 Tax=Arachis ipaensis TaxID=130454 RepID=UPI000A2B98FF|nr:uncharacterized protein LOC110263786 [Arachis ipaensis]